MIKSNLSQIKMMNNANASSNINMNSNSNNNNNNCGLGRETMIPHPMTTTSTNMMVPPALSQQHHNHHYQQQQQQPPPPSDSYRKLGNVYMVGYLGSAILTKGKTGLGCLQQPLRELYYIYRQNGARLLQERRVIISLDGITMLFNEFGIEKYLHNDLASVYDVQLLQLMCEHKKDKKLYCAFLPIGKNVFLVYLKFIHIIGYI
jgi:hypothetical protein